MKAPNLLVIAVTSVCLTGYGQVFIYDQQSVTSDNEYSDSFDSIQANQPIGQSFTPALSSVGFVRLYISNGGENPTPVTVYANLLADSITGPVLGQSEPVTVPGLAPPVNFFFSNPVAVTPGMTYYLQPMLVGNNPNIGVNVSFNIFYQYSGGTAFVNGVSVPSQNLWFREGIVVPEPSSVWLVLLGSGVWFYVRRIHRNSRCI